jgi:NAD(P)-dependent dehydrogenase (short-subunit alcohol dehydrogenase family)
VNGPDITGPDGTKDAAGTLDGKRALVTGGTRGMGAAIAELLAARNARVLVTARHLAANSAGRLIQADLAAPGGADIVAGEAIRLLGELDIVVHCVGAPFAKPGGALALTDQDWMDSLNTNLLAAVRLDRAVLPAMIRQRSGVIVHVSTLQMETPAPVIARLRTGQGSPAELQQGPRHRGRPPRRPRDHGHARLHRNPARRSQDHPDHGPSHPQPG